MTQDQNKKTLRHFQCRDYLWEIFEQMSAELECSTDYLINEALRQYARSRNYGTSQRAAARVEPEYGALGGPAQAAPVTAAVPQAPQAHAPIPSLRSAEPGPPAMGAPPMAAQPLAQAPVHSQAPTMAPARPPTMPPPPRPAPPRPQVSAPPPLPGAQPGMAPGSAARPLFLIFNGQKIPILKEEFVIGRGSKSADLPIKDGNISRRHAAVVLHHGVHYIKDLGSTNGIEFQGRRFESRRIDEGDVYRLCDYELQFTFQ